MQEEQSRARGAGEPPGSCQFCGAAPDDPLAVLVWTLDVHDDGQWQWICPECSRDHLPEIEARLHLGEP